ncbi:MAG: beta-hexosaminidase [Oscillospiraceae bacterium]|nr:beta-hexosaminidase [Oscillospiraceae bacterium]
MKRFFSLLLALAMLVSLCACNKTMVIVEDVSYAELFDELPETVVDAEPTEDELRAAAVDKLLTSMTKEELVGQLVFARVPAENAVADVSAYKLGGYILFGRDTEGKTANDIIQTISAYQNAAKTPLFIGVDEEGGSVVRVSSNKKLRSEKFLSPQSLLISGGMDAIIADTHEKDLLLRALGFNVNFAPVADVCTKPSAFIFPRAFGQNGAATANYVEAVVEQMNADGMASVIKHFPGYGDSADTHTGTVTDERTMEAFTGEDLLPFRAGVEAGAPFVLVSHNIVTCMDAERPASLSPAVNKILREQLGSAPLAITDDLSMAAAQVENAAVLAIAAGNDMILSTNYQADIAAILAAIEDGTLSLDTVKEACRRVLTCKAELGILKV